MDRALSGGRFHDKASGKPEMVRHLPAICCHLSHVAGPLQQHPCSSAPWAVQWHNVLLSGAIVCQSLCSRVWLQESLPNYRLLLNRLGIGSLYCGPV